MSARETDDPRRRGVPPAQLDAFGELGFGPDEPRSLVDLINRVLDRGVVLHGDVTISVAGVDLVYLGLNALLTSVSTARRALPGHAGLPPALPRGSTEPAAGRPAVGSLQATSTSTSGVARTAASPPTREPGPGPEAGARVPRAAADMLAERLVEVAGAMPSRVEIDPDGVQRDLGRLVLTVVELLRQVVEHQAVRRMEDSDLSEEQVERMGEALLRLEEKMREIQAVFDLADDDLNIDLGPLGKLL